MVLTIATSHAHVVFSVKSVYEILLKETLASGSQEATERLYNDKKYDVSYFYQGQKT